MGMKLLTPKTNLHLKQAMHHGDDSRRPVPGIDFLQPWVLGVECMLWDAPKCRHRSETGSVSASCSCSALKHENDDKSKERPFMEDV